MSPSSKDVPRRNSASPPRSSSGKRILVVGGTGMLGAPVVRRLVADGHSVRVLTRGRGDPSIEQRGGCGRAEDLPLFLGGESDGSIEFFQGDVTNYESLENAVEGCAGIHINLSGGELERVGAERVASVVAARRKEKGPTCVLERITLISGISVCEENARRFAKTGAKLAAETAVIESGADYTIFRCTMFMETLPKWDYLVGSQPTKWHWIAADDYASMVSRSYATAAAANKILYIRGPGPALTLREAIDGFFIPICAPDRGRISSYPEWLMRALSSLPGCTNETVQTVTIPKFSWLAQISELGDSREANDLLGAPSTAITEWCDAYNRNVDDGRGR